MIAANMKTNEDISQQKKKRGGAAKKEKDTAKKKSPEQVEKDREKSRMWRKRNMYERQIRILEGGLDNLREEVDVWVGDAKNGSFQKLVQLTRIAEVRNMSPFLWGKNLKLVIFQGAIVALGKPEDRNYEVILESNFKVYEKCMSQDGNSLNAMFYPAQRLIGICCGVSMGLDTGWTLAKWVNNETRCLPHFKVQEIIIEGKRNGASTMKVANINDRPQTQIEMKRDYHY